MTCVFCGAQLHGTYCSRCGRRASDGSAPPSFLEFRIALGHLDARKALGATLLVAAAGVMFVLPAVGAAVALLFLLWVVRSGGQPSGDVR
jgi:hypothetical protein